MIGGLGDPLEVLLDGPGCVLPTPADDPLALGADNFDRLEFLDAAAPTQLSASGDQKVSGPLRQALWGKQIAGAVDLDGDYRHDLRSSGQPVRRRRVSAQRQVGPARGRPDVARGSLS
jgi:hypothetical protein